MMTKPFFTYWKADMLRTLRDRRFVLFTMVMPVGFYLIFIHEGHVSVPIAGTFWNAYFMVSMATFGVIGSAVNTLGVRLAAERKGGWVRWLQTTPLSSLGYTVSKIAKQLTLSLIIVGLVFGVARVNQHIALSLGQWVKILLWIWVGSIPFAALGVLIGFAGNAAQVLGTLVYLTMSLLGGLWTPVQALPQTMQTIARWMPTYRYARPAWNLLSNRPITVSDALYLCGYTLLFVAGAVLIQSRSDITR